MPFHTDAVQAVGRVPVDVRRPRRRPAVDRRPQVRRAEGRGRAVGAARPARCRPSRSAAARSGVAAPAPRTSPAIEGLRVAAERAARATLASETPRQAALRDRLEQGLLEQVPGAVRQRRRGAARAEHHQHQLRGRRGRIARDRRSTSRASRSRPAPPARRARSSRRTCCGRWACRRRASQGAVRFSLGPGDHRGRDRPRARGACRPWSRAAARAGGGAWLTPACACVVAMSGGVDSSVAAALLVGRGPRRGRRVDAALRRSAAASERFGSCCTIDDLHDARRVAHAPRHPPLHRQSRAAVRATVVVANFVREYAAGGRRIPCAHCNSELKFSALVEQRARVRRRRAWRPATTRASTRDAGGRCTCSRGADDRQGPGVLPVRADAGAARPRDVSGGRHAEGRRAAHGRRARPARGRQARQPGDLLRPGRRLRGASSTGTCRPTGAGLVVDAAGPRASAGTTACTTSPIGQRKGLGISSPPSRSTW
ncbi:MAG: hypothetical protein MZV64_72845 [Ignavibacteriales bacterium]|nr:hypothetical protein [Ignavibacteriales bacterium]